MKKRVIFAITLLLAASLLMACDNGESTSQNTSGVAGSSSPGSESESNSSTGSESSSGSASESNASAPAESADVAGIAAQLSEAAGLGSTLEFKELDLVAQFGVAKDDVVAFAGFYSLNVSENGGEVMVIQAAEGQTEAVMAALGVYRERTASNDLYAEFAAARENVKNARIVTEGDIVVYAVSAAGTEEGWKQLDEAITAAFNS